MYQQSTIPNYNLEPFIDIISLQAHYQIYLDNLKNLNSLLQSINYDYSLSMKDLINNIDIIPISIRGEVLYYLSSVLNHNLYFYNLSTKQNQLPLGIFARDLIKNFGSYENFKNEFKKQALNLKGSGYTFLVKEDTGTLKILNTSNEDSPYYYGFTPIITLDLWEHAYFLKYKNNKEKYIDNFFKVLDLEKVNIYYEKLIKS